MQDIQTPKDLKKRLDAKNPNDVLLDVRAPQEFSEGHIKGSINFNISTLNVINNIKQLDKAKNYILYCRSGGRSQMASMIMRQNGLDVTNCQFGFIHLDSSEIEIAY
jgi:phage shock protein E